MPNDSVRLLNNLNSYISCSACKSAYEIRIILRCGHSICNDCKIQRNKCPNCFANVSSTRTESPSVRFICDLRKELLKKSPDLLLNKVITAQTKKKNILNRKEEISDTMDRSRLDKRQSSIEQEQKVDSDNDVIIIESYPKDKKSIKEKRRKVLYGSYRNEEKSHRIQCKQILNDVGIAGIDKGAELNGQLYSIISQLNSGWSRTAEGDRGTTGQSKRPSKDGDDAQTQTSNASSEPSSKRIRTENKTPTSKSNVNYGSGTKKCMKIIGGIVDGEEIVQRYSNACRRKSTEEEKEKSSANQRDRQTLDKLLDPKNSQITFIKCSETTKSSTNKSDLSELAARIADSLSDDELQPDIMADMLNNVSNEIVIVGSECTMMSSGLYTAGLPSGNTSIDKDLSSDPDVICISDSEDEAVTENDNDSSDNNKIPLVCPDDSTVRKCSESIPDKVPMDNKNLLIKDDLENEESNIEVNQPSHAETSKQSSEKRRYEPTDFNGFTEENILISTVKLSLFKMYVSKYADIKSASSSLLTLDDGKQILIQNVSQSEENIGCSNQEKKSSDLTEVIEVSDSEDESFEMMVLLRNETENETPSVTPTSTSRKCVPVSIIKVRNPDELNEKFMENDVLDTSEPLTPFLPKREVVAKASTTMPVSRRQLTFASPLVDKTAEQVPKNEDTNVEDEMPQSSSNEDWKVLHHRMLCAMHSCPGGSLQSEFERSDIRATRLTLTTCSLNTKETALVTKLARMTNSCLTKDFTHDTTHLIIGSTGRGTLEYYLAIAYRAFIVSMEWVTLCIALNKIIPVTGFIPTEDEGPLKCLEPISPPFVGFYICSKISSTSNYPIAEITKTLLSLGGAKLLPDIDKFQTLQESNYPRFFVYDANSQITQAILDKCASMRIVPIQSVWVYESVCAFRALPVMDYLGTIIHSRTLIRDYKIPEHLACSRYPRLEGEIHPRILDERYQRSL